VTAAAAPDLERVDPAAADGLAVRPAQTVDPHDRWACGRAAEQVARATDRCRDIRPELIIELL
jgi:hypothetical protein